MNRSYQHKVLHKHTLLNTHQKGMTLIEILVAFALGAFLTTAVVQIVSSNKRSITLSESFNLTQEYARLATDILSRELRNTGARGCFNRYNPNSYNDRINSLDGEYDAFWHNYVGQKFDAINDFAAGVDYSSAAQRNRMPQGGTFDGITPEVGTDVFINRGTAGGNLVVATQPTNEDQPVQVTGPLADINAITDESVVLISDCSQADFFVVTQNNNGLLSHDISNRNGKLDNASDQLTVAYDSGSQISILNTSAFFIAPSQIIDNDLNDDGIIDVFFTLQNLSAIGYNTRTSPLC